METDPVTYHCAIIGGGLSGLCLAAQLADKGISVIVFEKNEFPMHKVCGEYISMESYQFLNDLGLIPVAVLPLLKEKYILVQKGKKNYFLVKIN